MSLPNIWNNILTWFQEFSERNMLVREFNIKAKESFISGAMPTMLKSSIQEVARTTDINSPRGFILVSEYKH